MLEWRPKVTFHLTPWQKVEDGVNFCFLVKRYQKKMLGNGESIFIYSSQEPILFFYFKEKSIEIFPLTGKKRGENSLKLKCDVGEELFLSILEEWVSKLNE